MWRGIPFSEAFDTAPSERGHRGRVMRRAERPLAADPALLKHARNRLHHADLERFGGTELWQYPRQAGRKQRLSRSRRADHQQVGYAYTHAHLSCGKVPGWSEFEPETDWQLSVGKLEKLPINWAKV